MTTINGIVLEDYLPLVQKICGMRSLKAQWSRAGWEFGDAVNTGFIGLMQAAESFDPLRGFAFSTHASTRIMGSVLDGLRAYNERPRRALIQFKEVTVLRQKMEAEQERTVDDREACAVLGISEERWAVVLAQISPVNELDRPLTIGKDGETSLLVDIIADENGYDYEQEAIVQDRRRRLQQAMDQLPHRQQTLISARLAEMTFAEISELLGVTESRVCQIYAQTMKQLTRKLNPDKAA